MPAPSKPKGSTLAAVLAACAIASPFVIASEGWVNKAYPDPARGWSLPTACVGSTRGIEKGRTYSDAECEAKLGADLLEHGLDIAPCLPAELPAQTRAAFISFGFNVGAKALCTSTLSRKALAGDLPGACAELDRWVYANGKKYPGLVTRRREERALCEAGLRP